MLTCLRVAARGVLAIAVVSLTVASPAPAQTCRDDSEGAAGFIWTRNENAGDFNFSYSSGGVDIPIRMADPTILKLKDAHNQTWFFVTGTTDGIGATPEVRTNNFPIFRSTNLRDWYFHSYVFDPALQGARTWDQDMLRIQHPNGVHRHLKHLWSPQLYYDPTDGNGRIYIAFAAAELKDTDLDDDGVPDEDLDWNASQDPIDPDSDHLSVQQISCMVAWTDKARFLTAGSPWITQTHNNWMPSLYGYRVNNVGAVAIDGGAAQAAATGVYTSIPTTGNTHESQRYKAFQYFCGYAVKVIFGFHWACEGPRSWMGDAPLVFFDPNNNCKPWMSWTWVQRGGLPVDQNNVAAFPMAPGSHSSTYNLMDATYANPKFGGQTQPLQLFTSWNNNNSLNGIPNGRIAADPANLNNPVQWTPADTGVPAGVAEGSDVFYYNNRYYAISTRNPVNSPAYQIVYRRSAAFETDVTNLHLQPWDVYNPPVNAAEDVLLASNWVRDVAGNRQPGVRTNFGHPQFFTAYGRAYIIFHKMLDVTTQERRIYIKELNFNAATGAIVRIWESYPYHDLHALWFKAPDVANVPTAPVP